MLPISEWIFRPIAGTGFCEPVQASIPALGAPLLVIAPCVLSAVIAGDRRQIPSADDDVLGRDRRAFNGMRDIAEHVPHGRLEIVDRSGRDMRRDHDIVERQ